MAKKAAADDAGARVPIQTRTSEALRDRLAEAAEKAGRSMAQEVELRLERSFDLVDIVNMAITKSVDKTIAAFDELKQQSEALMLEQCGGDDLFLFWQLPATVIKHVERQRGKSIREDEETRRAAERLVLGAITDVFHKLPPTYTEWKAAAKRDAAQNKETSRSPNALAALGAIYAYDDDIGDKFA